MLVYCVGTLVACGESSNSPPGAASGGSGGGGGGSGSGAGMSGTMAGTGAVPVGGSAGGGTGGGAGGASLGGSGGGPARPVAPELPVGWQRRELIVAGKLTGVPNAVIDSSGRAHVAARVGNGLAMVSLDQDGFGTPQLLAESFSYGVALAINESDQGVAVWAGLKQDGPDVMTAAFSPQAVWVVGPGIGVPDDDSFTSPSEFDVAISKNGTALAVWMDGQASPFVRSAHYDGNKWSERIDVAASGFAEFVRPAVGIDDQGHGAAIWRHTDDGTVLHDVCHGATFDGAKWSPGARVNGDGDGCYLPSLRLRGNGDGFALFEHEDDVHSINLSSAGFGAESSLSPSDTMLSAYGANPGLAVNASEALAVWREEGPGSSNFKPTFAVHQAGKWGAAAVIPGDDGDMEPSASVAINASGHGIAAWTSTSQGLRRVSAARYTPGVGFEPTFVLDAGLDKGDGVTLSADINDAGDIVVVWDRRDDEKKDRAMTAYFRAAR